MLPITILRGMCATITGGVGQVVLFCVAHEAAVTVCRVLLFWMSCSGLGELQCGDMTSIEVAALAGSLGPMGARLLGPAAMHVETRWTGD